MHTWHMGHAHASKASCGHVFGGRVKKMANSAKRDDLAGAGRCIASKCSSAPSADAGVHAGAKSPTLSGGWNL